MMLSVVLADAESTIGVLYAYQHSDLMGKAVVLALGCLSVFSWTLILDKMGSLRRSNKLSAHFIQLFNDNHGSLIRLARETNDSPVSNIYAEGVDRLLGFYEEAMPDVSLTADLFTRRGVPRAPVKLTPVQLESIEAALDNAVSFQTLQLESGIGYLATVVSLSPFLGLFGTVWGVMMAFCGIAMAGKADFTALAPGVAGALLTTVAGLVVAIPAMISYNQLINMIRRQTVDMDNFAESFIAQLKLEQASADIGRQTPVQE